MAVTLAVTPRLVQGTQRKLAWVAILALNPIMGLDLLFGQNDSFVLCWILFALVALKSAQTEQAVLQSAQAEQDVLGVATQALELATPYGESLFWTRLCQQADGVVFCAIFRSAPGERSPQ